MSERRLVSLGDIASVKAGNPAPQDKKAFSGGTRPFIRTSDVGDIHVGEIWTSRDQVNEKAAAKLRLFPAGTVLFPKSGASTFTNHRVLMRCEGYVASHLAAISADPASALDDFLFYYLQTVDARDLVQDQSYPSLNLKTIAAITIPLPSLDEQRRIVAKLDETLLQVDRSLALKRAAYELRKSALGRAIDVVLDRYSDGGVLVELSDLAESITDGDHGTPPKADCGIPFITISNIDRDQFSVRFEGTRCVPQEYFDGLKETRKPQLGDLLVTTNGTLGVPVVVAEPADFAFQRDISLIRPLEGVDPHWLSYSIRSTRGQAQISREARGAAQQHLYLGELRKLGIPKPVGRLQEEAVTRLRAIESHLERLRRVQADEIALLVGLRGSVINALLPSSSPSEC